MAERIRAQDHSGGDRGGCLPDLVAAHAAQQPDAPAVLFGDRVLCYAELDARASRLARVLRARGVEDEERVGICLERSIELVVAILGTMKAGAAYVPLDPAYPDDRLDFMLRDSGARSVLTQRSLRARVSASAQALLLEPDDPGSGPHAEQPTASRARPERLAYVIYTSGSTGVPKGVLVEHRGLCNVSDVQRRMFGVRPDSRILQLASASFDASIFEISMALSAGATLCMAPGDALLPGPALLAQLRDRAITHLTITPSALAALPGAELAALEMIAVAGEACPAELVARWAPGRRLLNLYGPTEASIWATAAECRDASSPPPIGLPIDGTRITLLDGDLQPVPDGGAGELYIGGVGVARGYLGRPDLTAERFIPDPFVPPAEAGARLYRTGDLARRRSDGNLEFAGRVDDQVKIRGLRIELGEIESLLSTHPAVRECAVVARDAGAGSGQLVAYFVATEPDTAPGPSALRSRLAEKLPTFMLPGFFVELAAMPLTPNGKLDREALPAPAMGRPLLDTRYAPPATDTQTTLTGIFSEVLGLAADDIGIDDDFFQLGGHSLLAVQVLARVRSALGREPSQRDFYEGPSVRALATAIETESSAARSAPAIVAVPHSNEALPTSPSQERVWFLAQMHPDTAAYHAEAVFRFAGPLDVDALEQSLNEIVRRHEIFRTSFPSDGGRPVQRVHAYEPRPLDRVDVSHLGEAAAREALERVIADEFTRPFDLNQPGLVRWKLVQTGADRHALVHVEHHLVHDGWSFGVFLSELMTLYDAFSVGAPSPLPEPTLQFADFAQWQRSQQDRTGDQLAYWKRQLAGGPVVSQLPTDHPRPAVQTLRGASLSVDLPLPLCDGLRALSRSTGASLYMVMLSSFLTLLARYGGETDLCVGAGMANRRWREIEGLIGMVINTVALRADLSGDPTFLELVDRVREVCLGAYENQDVPFGQVVDAVSPPRSASYSPLYQVMFSFHDSPMPDFQLRGAATELSEGMSFGSSKFDLNVFLIPRAEQHVAQREATRDARMTLVWEYSTDLFGESTMRRMLRHFQTLLEGVVAFPEHRISRLPLLAEEDFRELRAWEGTERPYARDARIQDLFEAQVDATPEAVAVVCGASRLSYAELDTRANQLAHHLTERGVGPEVLVGVCLERSVDAVVSLLAVLKAGGAYVPLDPQYPRERLALMVDDTRLPALLTQESLRDALPRTNLCVVSVDGDRDVITAQRSERPSVATTAESLAYVIYTSGSTGRPKGVEAIHRGVVRLVDGTDYVELGPDEAVLQLAPISFDAATFEIWGALLHGGRLVVVPERRLSLEELGAAIQREQVTTLWLTAPLFHQMVAERIDGLTGVRQLLAGGDVLSVEHVSRALTELEGCTVINGYGPTENTTFTCCHRMAGSAELGASVPIGRPIANTRVHIVDANMQPTPTGVAGELLIGGDGLARGYLGAPALTAERFVPDPFGAEPGGRLYRSGDLARRRVDGTVEFLGRMDTQLKVRGFRVEPGEIEDALVRHPDVKAAVVVAHADPGGDKRLIAHVVVAQQTEPDATALSGFLARQLPDYMVPAQILFLDELPKTPSGKIDRKRLPDPEPPEREQDHEIVAPRTQTETVLVDIWCDVLQRDDIGVLDDFFALGGHSLLATRVASRVAARLGVELPLHLLFRQPTVADLAMEIDAAAERPAPPGAAPPIVRARRSRRVVRSRPDE